jgi:hypothetical protein
VQFWLVTPTLDSTRTAMAHCVALPFAALPCGRRPVSNPHGNDRRGRGGGGAGQGVTAASGLPITFTATSKSGTKTQRCGHDGRRTARRAATGTRATAGNTTEITRGNTSGDGETHHTRRAAVGLGVLLAGGVSGGGGALATQVQSLTAEVTDVVYLDIGVCDSNVRADRALGSTWRTEPCALGLCSLVMFSPLRSLLRLICVAVYLTPHHPRQAAGKGGVCEDPLALGRITIGLYGGQGASDLHTRAAVVSAFVHTNQSVWNTE